MTGEEVTQLQYTPAFPTGDIVTPGFPGNFTISNGGSGTHIQINSLPRNFWLNLARGGTTS